MTYLLTMIILALLGVGETVYLISKRRKNQKPICVGKNDCNIVLKSKYNKTFSIHNDVLGLAFYLFTLFVHIRLMIPGCMYPSYVLAAFWIGLIIALMMSTRFVYLMAFKFKAWCQWCVASAVTVMLMSMVVLFWILSALMG